MRWLLLIGLAVSLVVQGSALAQAPRTITLQGRLTDTSGTALPDGDYVATLRLYTEATGGVEAWSETETLTVRGGVFSTALGDQTPFPLSLSWDRPYYLGVQIGTDAEMSPRLTLHAAPYALNAGTSVNSLDVRSFGARGDGITDDTLAIRAAIAAAGRDRTIVFPSGATFLLTGSLIPMEGQTFWGYGARLKRANQITTTTTSAINTVESPISVTVTNASAFRAGMEVTVFDANGFDANNHLVLSVQGNTISLGTRFSTAFPAGATLVTSFSQVNGSAPGVRILGLEFDGNRANNTAIQKWQNHNEIRISSDRGIIRDCYIHDAQSEGIQAGGVGMEVRGNFITDSNGNGIHMSGSTGARVLANYIRRSNLAGTGPGHADGAIIFSNLTGDTVVADNYIDSALSGIGSIDSDDNSGVVIRGNTIRNCSVYALDMVANSLAMGRVIFEGNLVYDSRIVSLNNTGAAAPGAGPYRTQIRGNYFENTRVMLKGASDITVSSNTFAITDTDMPAVVATNTVRLIVSGNQFSGGSIGVNIDGGTTRDAAISDNICLNQRIGAIRFTTDGMVNVAADGNTITGEAGSVGAGYVGILLAAGTSATGNRMSISAGLAGIQMPQGVADKTGGIATQNIIRSSPAVPSILVPAGARNNIATGNFIEQDIANASAESNTLSPNTKVAY